MAVKINNIITKYISGIYFTNLIMPKDPYHINVTKYNK